MKRENSVGTEVNQAEIVDFLMRLNDLKNSRSDEIPSEKINGTDGKKYKVQKNWRFGFTLLLDNILNKQIINDQFTKVLIEKFIEKYCSESFRYQEWVTKSNIEEANYLLKRVSDILGKMIASLSVLTLYQSSSSILNLFEITSNFPD